MYTEILGPTHPYVATVLNSLAMVYQDSGQVEKEELTLKQAITLLENDLEKNKGDLADNLETLGTLYADQGRYSEAEPLLKRAFTFHEMVYGMRSSEVATDMNGLATLYALQQKYRDAEPLYQESIQIFEDLLGPNHPYVAAPLNGLAMMYQEQKKYGDAEKLYQKALGIYEKLLGPENLELSHSLTNLAKLYDLQRAAKAEEYYQRAILVKDKTLGDNHPDLVPELSTLALYYIREKRFINAENILKRVVHIDEANPNILKNRLGNDLNDLATAYQNQGKKELTESTLKKAIGLYEKNNNASMSFDDPFIAVLMNHLAEIYRQTNRLEEAKIIEEAADKIEATQNPSSSKSTDTLQEALNN
ncbi:MAG: tetratricopeptide repeat protein [Cyanobacteria bacterium]|nr:tetratricopeptide repeat protein [Cyanobacteriota bacterium]